MARRRRLICASAALLDGADGVRFEVERNGAPEAAFAIRFEGQVHAYLNRCAHVPVELDWLSGQFFDLDRRLLLCATHGAVYDPRSGACRGGPCRGGGLEPLPVCETEDAVWLLE
ncbi:MAG: Rieske 2Fe-2S domain-containing protein [Rhodocyclaceae bacterium]|nr:Rieske 2Fe-2S domain-containing protein [Rhodocyclaceae bacterium]